MLMEPTATVRFNSFLLPTCAICAGFMTLSHVEPATEYEFEKRVYRCSECAAEQMTSGPFVNA
jgi:hypothetical protein